MSSPVSCRVCNSDTISVGSLGDISISNFTSKPQISPKYPLDLVYCGNCSLLQLDRETPRELLYKDYWYRSSLNREIVADLQSIASQVQGEIHIDIGGNDGTLLKYSKAQFKIAIDPSNIKPNGFEWVNDYWEFVTLPVLATTITAIACLYDLPDPNRFMKNVKNHLANDGIFICQLMTLQPMIENNDLGNICHEHIEYYSYKSLVTLFEQNGLEIYKVKKNDINGGSYRIFARHYEKGSVEFNEPSYTAEDMKYFFKRLERNRDVFLDWKKNKQIVGYGASTKMGTIVQYYNWSPDKIVDINPNKVGKYTVAGAKVVNKIPKGTEYLWVFPYGFIDYFKSKEDYDGEWITTMPELTIC